MISRAMDVQKAIRYHDQSAIWLACLRCDDGIEFGRVVNGCDDRLQSEGRSGGFERVSGKCWHTASLLD